MNLRRIPDTVSLKAYKRWKQISPNNFYFVLANALANIMERGLTSADGKALGVEYHAKNKDGFSLTLNGKTFKSEAKSTTDVIGDIVKQIFDAELNGFEIPRREGSSLYDDRKEFQEAKGTVFPTLYKTVKRDNPLANKQPNTAIALTSTQFELLKRERKAFKPDEYKKYTLNGKDFYVKKGVYVWDAAKDLKDAKLPVWIESLSNYSDVLYENYPDAKKFYDQLEYTRVVVTLKRNAYVASYNGDINYKKIEL